MFYWTLLNIPPLHRSKLNCINLLAVVNAKIFKKYGFDEMMRPTITDVKRLAEEVSKAELYNSYCHDTNVIRASQWPAMEVCILTEVVS